MSVILAPRDGSSQRIAGDRDAIKVQHIAIGLDLGQD